MRIGNPQDGAGDVLITGISAISAGSTISTGITAIEGGSNVTLSVPSNGVISISVDLSGMSSSISSKMNKPSSFGSSGQVLKTNGTGGTYWDDAGVASVTWESIGGKPSSVSAMPSEVGSNGALLTAGANGTMRWEAPATAVSYDNGKAVAASAVYDHVSAHANNGRHLPSPSGNQNCVVMVNQNGTQYILSSAVAFASSAVHATSAGSVDWNNVSNRPTLVTMSSVQSLPTTGIHENVIYLVPSQNPSTHNAKDEYIRQNGAWERIGTTEISAEAYDSHIADYTIHVPSFTSSNNGQALKVVNGELAWGSDITGGAGGLPSYGSANSGQVLQVNSEGTGVEWIARANGDMTVETYVSGVGIVKSAMNATVASSANSVSATQVNGLASAVSAMKATSGDFGVVRIGSGITVQNGVISVSATGGGGGVVDGKVTYNGSNAVAGSAVWSHVASEVALAGGGDMMSEMYDSDFDGTVDAADVAHALASSVQLGSATFDGTSSVTLAQMGAASATHSHSTADIQSFGNSVSNVVNGMVHDATITLTQGGVAKGSFTLNQSTSATIALDAGGEGSVAVDSALSPVSENPVQNMVIWSMFDSMHSGIMVLGLMMDRAASAIVAGSAYLGTQEWSSSISVFRAWWSSMSGESSSSSGQESSSSSEPSSSSSEEISSSSESSAEPESSSDSSSEQESSSDSSESESQQQYFFGMNSEITFSMKQIGFTSIVTIGGIGGQNTYEYIAPYIYNLYGWIIIYWGYSVGDSLYNGFLVYENGAKLQPSASVPTWSMLEWGHNLVSPSNGNWVVSVDGGTSAAYYALQNSGTSKYPIPNTYSPIDGVMVESVEIQKRFGHVPEFDLHLYGSVPSADAVVVGYFAWVVKLGGRYRMYQYGCGNVSVFDEEQSMPNPPVSSQDSIIIPVAEAILDDSLNVLHKNGDAWEVNDNGVMRSWTDLNVSHPIMFMIDDMPRIGVHYNPPSVYSFYYLEIYYVIKDSLDIVVSDSGIYDGTYVDMGVCSNQQKKEHWYRRDDGRFVITFAQNYSESSYPTEYRWFLLEMNGDMPFEAQADLSMIHDGIYSPCLFTGNGTESSPVKNTVWELGHYSSMMEYEDDYTGTITLSWDFGEYDSSSSSSSS